MFVLGRLVEVPISRGLAGSQGQRGKSTFPRFSGSLLDARSDTGRSEQPFDEHSSRAGKLRLHTVSPSAPFCNASYTKVLLDWIVSLESVPGKAEESQSSLHHRLRERSKLVRVMRYLLRPNF